ADPVERIAGDVEGLLVAGPALDGQHRAVLLKDRLDQDGFVDEAAAIAAEVEDESFGAATIELLDLVAKLAVSAPGEAGKGDVADLVAAGLLELAGHARNLAVPALALDLPLLAAGVDDGQADAGPGRALDPR